MPEPEGGVVLKDVTAGYGGRPVVHDVTLAARPGSITGLIGPNGSGKTTLVRVASRGLPPMSGRVRVCGLDPYAMPAKQTARLVAVVPQDLAPAFPYSVLEMVLMGRSPYLSSWGTGTVSDWAQARRAMASANVQHLADRPFAEISGGERQRVILAQALAQDAPVLLLDEPTTHLDIRHVLEILTLVRTMAADQGTTVLAIFHDLNLAAAYCDRVIALAAGRVVASGPPGSVLTAGLMREVFGVEAEVSPAGTAGRPSVVVSPPLAAARTGGRRAHVIGGAGRGAVAMRVLAELGFAVSTGILHAGDTDEGVATRLNLERVTVPPFSSIDARALADCRQIIAGASLLVVCDPPIGPGNLANLDLALETARAGVPTLLIEQIPMAERDFTGGRATVVWQTLKELCATLPDAQSLAELLAAQARPGSG